MATYYVRPDGNNANAGTGSAAGQAWQTVQYALTNATLTTGVNYIYIAPGVYRESVTLNITPTSLNTLVISGDPNTAQFSGVTQGVVRLTNFVTDNANPAAGRVFYSTGKSYFTIENLCQRLALFTIHRCLLKTVIYMEDMGGWLLLAPVLLHQLVTV